MRLIDADALIRDLIDNRSFYPVIVKSAIQAAPTIEAEPVKHGRWVKKYDYCDDEYYQCSSCNEDFYLELDPAEFPLYYCPNCGAKMGGETDG